MRAAWILLLAACCARPLFAREGRLRTLDGTTLSGEVTFATNGWTIQPPGGDPVRVTPEQMMELIFPESNPQPDSVTNAPTEGGSGESGLEWTRTPVGNALAGRVVADTQGWTVTGGGSGLHGNADSCFLAQRQLEASGQVLGELRSFDGTAPEAMAGLTLRDNAGEAAAYAFVGQRAGTGLCFQYRQIAGGMTMRVTNVVLSLPAWLRLSRVGGAVVAEISRDGHQWRPLGRANVNLGQSVRAGMVVASGSDATAVTAQFGHAALGARGAGYVPETGYPRLVLRGGSIVVAPIASADESVIRLGGDLSGSLISVLNVARIEFVPPTPELQGRLDAGRIGVFLSEGDFFDGDLRGVSTNTVTMGSLLFGYRKFAAGSEAAVVQLARTEPGEETFRIALENGSRILARQVEVQPDALRAESPLLGSLSINPAQVREVRRSEGTPVPPRGQ